MVLLAGLRPVTVSHLHFVRIREIRVTPAFHRSAFRFRSPLGLKRRNCSSQLMARDSIKVIGIIVLVLLALGAVSAFFQLNHEDGADIQKKLADTRASLRAQGFKTDLADFNLETDPAGHPREETLTFLAAYPRSGPLPSDLIDMLP